MVAKEEQNLVLQLQRLCEVVANASSNTEEQKVWDTQQPLLLADVARAYSTCVGGTKALTVLQLDHLFFHQALHLSSMLLAVVDSHCTSNKMLSSTEEVESIIRCTLEGLESLVFLFSTGMPTTSEMREEIISVVRFLVGLVAQEQQTALRVTPVTYSPHVHSMDGSKSQQLSRSALMDRRLWCAWALVERGFSSFRDVEQLFCPSSIHGKVLQWFLLKTLQDEFTTMRRHADGLLISSGGRADDNLVETIEVSNGCLVNNFWYYVCPTALGNSPMTQRGRSASTSSFLLNKCTAPLSPVLGESFCGQSNGCCGDFCGNTPRRIVCQNSAAVQWSLAVLMSLAVREEMTLHEQYDETSDFVDFVGDLLSICSVVVSPFLTKQLETVEQMYRETSVTIQDGKTLQEGTLSLLQEIENFRRYTGVVEQFISSWEPCFSVIRASTLCDNARCVAEEENLAFVPATIMGGFENKKEKDERENKNVVDSHCSVAVAELGKKNKDELQWVPVAPSLAAHLELSTRHKDFLSRSDVVSLFTEVKQFRETERAALWNYWMQQRRKTNALAANVVSMQQRCNALVEARTLLYSINGTSKEVLQREWKDLVSERVRELEVEIQRCQCRQ